MPLSEGRVGPFTVQDGVSASLRFGRLSDLIVNDGHARYKEAVSRGRVFSGGTAATGVAPGTAIGTTAAFAITNPLGSGFNLVILRASMGYVSGTLGAGVIHYLANTNTQLALPTGTAITAVNALLGSGNAAVARPFTTATIASPTILRPFVSSVAMTAAQTHAPWQTVDEVAGEFIVTPGATLSLHGTMTAGSSPLVVFGMTWEEVPV